ncbi:sensor domain-containing protein [Tamaricihabitans halophyticus]|nr:sensor domain-containing protein [Tamaricihabitans halophyticus]
MISQPATSEYDGVRRTPSIPGAVAYLLLGLPLGIFWFVLFVTLFLVGLTTSIIWVGVPILMLAAVLLKAAAMLERRRVNLLLGGYIADPYRPLPSGMRAYWKARTADPASWRDLSYFLLLLPVGVIGFALTLVPWAIGLGWLFLPIYFRFLPTGSWRFPDWDQPWVIVDSTMEALPWAGLGLLITAVAIVLTRAFSRLQLGLARALLGPGAGTQRLAEQAHEPGPLPAPGYAPAGTIPSERHPE